MYNPVNSTNAIHTAYDGMKTSSNNAVAAPQQVEKTNKQSDKAEAAKRKKKRAKVQTMNLKSGMRRGKNTIDVVA
jgi:hypothetical protein